MKIPDVSSDKNRWLALVFLSLGLAIVIIDNTVLNVAIPYILRDLHASFDSIEWVVSGYALIIATLLITMGRLGDLFGRKRIFILGTVVFAIGSFIASLSLNATVLFLGEALIEAVGASMMLTSSLSLVASEFRGKERSIAFGVWGSVAGASSAIGPLLGGYLTSYYSWRWSLRINVVVAIIAIIGSVFIKESKGEGEKRFDWKGTVLSGLGLFSLVFGLIEGQKYGWLSPNQQFTIGGWQWPFAGFSIIPVIFTAALLFLTLFILNERAMEKRGDSPLLRLTLFKNRSFDLALTALGIISLGQFGVFFILPIFLQNVLGMNAFNTGLVFLSSSLFVIIFGPLSGFLSSKIGPKWLASIGMFVLALGTYMLMRELSVTSTRWSLAPSLAIFGIGIGLASAQLTNIILSSVQVTLAGEASALNSTIRQVGTSIGIAVMGVVLSSTLASNIGINIRSDSKLPSRAKEPIIASLQNVNAESGIAGAPKSADPVLGKIIKDDVNNALTTSAKKALSVSLIFITLGAFFSLIVPGSKVHTEETEKKPEIV